MSNQRERDQKLSDEGRAKAAEEESEHPNANEDAGRVVLSTPEQKELAEDSDIEYEDTPGVPGQIQYPANSSFGQYASDEDEDDEPRETVQEARAREAEKRDESTSQRS